MGLPMPTAMPTTATTATPMPTTTARGPLRPRLSLPTDTTDMLPMPTAMPTTATTDTPMPTTMARDLLMLSPDMPTTATPMPMATITDTTMDIIINLLNI